jgi:DNA-binding CsgD family transcriptional regulator
MSELTKRQAEVVERVASDMPDKQIAAELGISIRTVRAHIQAAADRIPGDERRRHKLTLFFISVGEEDAA